MLETIKCPPVDGLPERLACLGINMSESVMQEFIIQRKGENHDILKEDYIFN